MKFNSVKQFGALLLAALTVAASAEILVYDGFPVGTGAYSQSEYALRDQNLTSSQIIGMTGRWANNNTGVVVSHANGHGLSMPENWTGQAVVGTSAGLHKNETPTGGNRCQWRKFSDGVFPSSGKIYFRFLMNCDARSLDALPTGTANYFYGAGLTSLNGSIDADNKGPFADGSINALWFAVRKMEEGTQLQLIIRQATGVSTTSCLLADSVVAGETYLCLAEIDIAAGAGGKEIVRAAVAKVSDNPDSAQWIALDDGSETVEAELLGGSKPVRYLSFGGGYQTNNGYVCLDEFAIATELMDVISLNDDIPVLGAAELCRTQTGYRVDGELTNGAGVAKYVIDDGTTAITNTIGSATAGTPITAAVDVSSLASDRTYAVSLLVENAALEADTLLVAGTLYTGELSLTKTLDATELHCVAGKVTVSRADAAPFPLAVNYAFSGTGEHPAAGGVNYEIPAGTVVIPADSVSAEIEVVPLVDNNTTADTTVSVALSSGHYTIGATVTVLIANYSTPEGYNYWSARADSDGLASTAANWSQGHRPLANEIVVVDGDFSQVDLVWDGESPDLTRMVKGWEQRANYTGTVTFNTTYSQSESAFARFTVNGAVVLNGGSWTHQANEDSEVYRLAVTVNGSFTLGANGMIDLRQKGYAKSCFPAGGALGVYAGGYGAVDAVYGDVYRPTNLGAGGSSYAGGGALDLKVTGAMTLDGVVRADSVTNNGTWENPYAGSGGSVLIEAASLTGSGIVNVMPPRYTHHGSSASGGRVALILSETDELELPLANIQLRGASGNFSSGGGTALIKTRGQTYGTLYLAGAPRNETFAHMYPTRKGTTLIPPGQIWTFDAIKFADQGILAVPSGATLRLPNGFASVSALTENRNSGILYLGGTIEASDLTEAVIQNNWVFQADTPFIFPGNVTVKNGAAIGNLLLVSHCGNAEIDPDIVKCEVEVRGDLTVEQTGALYATGAGVSLFIYYVADNVRSIPGRFNGAFSHGGQIGYYDNVSRVYGSILNPSLPGTVGFFNDSAKQILGGGALTVRVGRTLTLDGTAVSNGGGNTYNGYGTGGSINITAGALTGTGSIEANGRKCNDNNRLYTGEYAGDDQVFYEKFLATAGGRIAIRLTGKGAAFSDHWLANIKAWGSGTSYAQYVNAMASAGTVYLQAGNEAEGAGTVYIRNAGTLANSKAVTPIPSLAWGGENDNLKKTSLVVDGAGHALVAADLRLARLRITENSTLDLAGHKLTVNSCVLGGLKLANGTYSASSSALADFVTDSHEGGTLLVTGGGLLISIR